MPEENNPVSADPQPQNEEVEAPFCPLATDGSFVGRRNSFEGRRAIFNSQEDDKASSSHSSGEDE